MPWCYLLLGNLQGWGGLLLGLPSILVVNIPSLAQRRKKTIPVDHSSLKREQQQVSEKEISHPTVLRSFLKRQSHLQTGKGKSGLLCSRPAVQVPLSQDNTGSLQWVHGGKMVTGSEKAGDTAGHRRW